MVGLVLLLLLLMRLIIFLVVVPLLPAGIVSSSVVLATAGTAASIATIALFSLSLATASFFRSLCHIRFFLALLQVAGSSLSLLLMVELALVVVVDIVVMQPSPSPVEVVWLGGGVAERKVFFLFFFDVDERGGERDAASALGKATLPTSSS